MKWKAKNALLLYFFPEFIIALGVFFFRSIRISSNIPFGIRDNIFGFFQVYDFQAQFLSNLVRISLSLGNGVMDSFMFHTEFHTILSLGCFCFSTKLTHWIKICFNVMPKVALIIFQNHIMSSASEISFFFFFLPILEGNLIKFRTL